jgi:hypothetical protein
MDIWVVCDVYECEYEFSTHLTEKGALLDICGKVLAWMDNAFVPDCDSEQNRLDEVWKRAIESLICDYDPPEKWANFDIKNWREMDCEGLWKFYDFISEFTWDSSSVDYTISRTSVTA